MGRVKIKVHSYINYTPKQIERDQAANGLLETVVNSLQFRNEVLNQDFIQTNGGSNQEIYQRILAGAEVLSPVADNEMDLELEMYSADNSVVGWTKRTIQKIYVNAKFFNKFDYAGICRNKMHEWLHKLGYGHDVKRTARRSDSVPYGVGEIVYKLVTKLVKGEHLTDVWSDHIEDTLPDPVLTPPEVHYRVVCTRTWSTLWLKKICKKVAV